jgi:hypothetical protein
MGKWALNNNNDSVGCDSVGPVKEFFEVTSVFAGFILGEQGVGGHT